MAQFDIIKYISSLTGFVIDKSVCERIAMERGVEGVTSIGELEQKTKDLLLADVLYYIYLSPNSSASMTKQHGAFTQTVGSQTINDKKGIYNTLIALYKKYDDDMLETVEAMEGGLQWLKY